MKPSVAASAVTQSIVLSSASQLASDTSFIAAVKMNIAVANILFNKMRLLGSNEARKLQSSRIELLLKQSSSRENISALASEFGFVDEYEFSNAFFTLLKRKIELSNRYSNYGSLNPESQRVAYNLVVQGLPNTSSAYGRGASVCVLCPFNNCDECFGNEGGGCPTCVEPPAGGDVGAGGSGYPYACIQRAQTKRASKIHTQEIILYGELFACGLTGAGVGGAVCTGTMWFPPLGVAAGAAGFCITAGGCGVYALALYRSEVATIEAEYQQERAQCF